MDSIKAYEIYNIQKFLNKELSRRHKTYKSLKNEITILHERLEYYKIKKNWIGICNIRHKLSNRNDFCRLAKSEYKEFRTFVNAFNVSVNRFHIDSDFNKKGYFDFNILSEANVIRKIDVLKRANKKS